MKIFGMEIPPKNEGAPLEKWYLKAKNEFKETLASGDPVSQMFALKKFDDISRKAEKKSGAHRDDFLKTFTELKTTKPELYTGYTYMQQEIMQSLSPVDYNKYLKTGELERHGKPMLGADGQPLFSDEKVVEMVALLSGADKEARSKIVKMIYEDQRFQNLGAYAKAATVAGFFAMQGLSPTEASANTLSSSGILIENSVDASYGSDNENEFRLVFNAETITKVEGDSLTLLGKKREVLDRKSPTELGLDANTPLKMKTGTKYKLVNAKERFDEDGDGKIKVWDGFPGKKVFCLVEIDLNTEGVFKLAEDTDDNLYAAYLDGEELCWNRIIEPETSDNGQFDEPETPAKKIERENNLIAKRGLETQWFLENPVTRTEQLIGRCVEIEEFNLDKYGGNSQTRMTKLYLVKQIDGNGDAYWKIVDGAADFNTYYPINNIVKGRFTEGYNGLNGTSYTVPVPEDLKGTAKEIHLASELLGLDVRK
ncbi:MAG: hypothetical protein KBC12_01300 [Candidatus Pacebacteria bacterium]|nr:hypothetical protein [Candidatus Paceibacterota bacterium]MBP9851445.1 hypothetical protein [Candidatus Paceibacterota bacterium]